MEIISLGHTSFKIKGKGATVVTDPFDGKLVGFPFPKHVTADIVTVSHGTRDGIGLVEGEPYGISGAGEYEVKNVSVIGIASEKGDEKKEQKNTMYTIVIDGMHIVYLGLCTNKLGSQDIEKLEDADILFIPVGGEGTLTPEEASQIISDMDPSIVIPMYYKTEKHNKEQFGKLLPVTDFLHTMGKSDVVPVSKLSITKDKLPGEMQIVVLE